jgi:ADP-ribose pyrophosphatase YjhB (NUDIX family)
MLDISPPDYKFCPFCGSGLEDKDEERRRYKYCHKCNWIYYPHVAASAGGVAIQNGRVLLVKRAREPYKDTWMVPAGFVSFGEHPEETVVREVKEETGLSAKVIKLLRVYQVDDDPRNMGHFAFMYEVEASGQIKIQDTEENQEAGWFELNNLPPIGWKGHQELLNSLR